MLLVFLDDDDPKLCLVLFLSLSNFPLFTKYVQSKKAFLLWFLPTDVILFQFSLKFKHLTFFQSRTHMAVSNANALIRPLSELFEVHLSHPYNATGQTNDFKGHSPVARLVFPMSVEHYFVQNFAGFRVLLTQRHFCDSWLSWASCSCTHASISGLVYCSVFQWIFFKYRWIFGKVTSKNVVVSCTFFLF